ncbi:hypothetical protein [Actinomadura nitritigenes]|uniref:hypothetical protein n=1 Tax=Actinomadura nitritigenes TaxID=134602 RepID=UPI003D92D2E6
MGVLTGEELAREPFLRGMRKADLTRLATAGRRVTIPAARRIRAEGRPAERFWIIDALLARTLCAVDTALGYELTRRFAELVVERLHATRLGHAR